MTSEFEHLDALSAEEVARFKDDAREKDYEARIKIATNHRRGDRIISEGDSWFDYKPGTDIIDCLRKHHGYAIDKHDNHAKAGDTLENMIHGASIDEDGNRRVPEFGIILEKIKKFQTKIFLFSGGGNDIAGDEFINYLNHHETGLPPIKHEYADSMINTTFKKLLSYMITEVTKASPNVTIVMHGYGHTAPTGKGVLWYGPWLKPALVKKKILDKGEQRTAVFYMIDEYNKMLLDLSAQHPNFSYVDLTKFLNPDNDWANELHLKNSKFAESAKMIHERIQTLTGGLTHAT